MIKQKVSPMLFLAMLLLHVEAPAQSTSLPEDSGSVVVALSALGADELDRGLEILKHNVKAVSPQVCQQLIHKANAFYRSSDFVRSALFFEFAREAAVLSGNKALLARSGLDRLGQIYADRDSVAKAIDADIRSKRIFEEINSNIDLILLMGDLGAFYRSTGDFESARAYSLRCLELSGSQAEDDPGAAFARSFGLRSAWCNLAWISVWEGDFSKAIDYVKQALDLSRRKRSTNPDWLAYDLIELSKIYRATGDYRQSLSCLTETLQIAQLLNGGRPPGTSPTVWFARPILSLAYNNLGLLYEYQADYPSAVKWLTLSLALAKETGDKRGTAAALSNLGDAYLAQKSTAAAIDAYREALNAAEAVGAADSIVTIRHGLGLAHRANGDFSSALSDLENAAKVADHLGDKNRLAETYCFKGEVHYSMGDLRAADELADKAYVLAESGPRPRPILWSLSLKGKVSLALERYDVARQAIQHAIDMVEGLRDNVGADEAGRAQFMEGSKIEPYRLMVELLLRNHEAPSALAVAEQAKARALLQVLRTGRDDIDSVMTPAERQRDRELSAKLTSLNKRVYTERLRSQPNHTPTADLASRLENARLEYQSFRDGVYSGHSDLRAHRTESRRLDLEHFADFGLGTKTALVEFIVTDEKTHVFLIMWHERDNNNGTLSPVVTTYSVNMTRKDLTDSVAAFAERLGNPHIAKDAMAKRLYELLLGPAKDLLAGKSSIAIVPDGVLWDLPFQALKQGDGKYLVEDYSIFYAPSLAVMSEMVKKTTGRSTTDISGGTLLALGNPTLNSQVIDRANSVHRDERLAPLPDAQREVTALRSLYGPAGNKIYVGAEAREDRAKAEMGNYRVLHFATHGILDSTSPMYSHIVLATDDKSPDDGLLEAWEIMRLDLKADLAVLSACDTARGKTEAGEGVIGMSWAFFVAGCPTTVVSQWKVDSASTADLMIEFHKNLVQAPPGSQARWRKAEALRKAMLTVMSNPSYRDPYYWAGFVVVGAG